MVKLHLSGQLFRHLNWKSMRTTLNFEVLQCQVFPANNSLEVPSIEPALMSSRLTNNACQGLLHISKASIM